MKTIINFFKEKKVFFNAFTTVLQLVITGISYLILYKILLHYVGIAVIGVWAIVVATSSIANMAGLGVSSGLVKFVAEYKESNQLHAIKELLFTAFIITIVLHILIAVIVYLISSYILTKVISLQYISLAKELIPFSLLSLVFNGCAAVFLSVLDGLQKNYIKNIIFIVSTLLYVLLVFLLLHFGNGNIFTVAKVQCIQAAFVFIFTGFWVTKLTYNYSTYTTKWNTKIFRQIFSYGFKFQVISLIQLLYEPLTKSLLSKFAGVSVVGYYDMASRLVFQVRGLIVSANQVLVPKIASNQSGQAITDVYTKSLQYLLIIVLPLMSALIFFAMPISFLWIGSYQESFIYAVCLLTVALSVNIMSGPAYFTFVALGKLNPLLISHILMGIINVVAAYMLTYFSSTYGVIIGWSLALLFGSYYVIHTFHKIYKTTFFAVLNKLQLNTLLIGLLILMVGCILNYYFKMLTGFKFSLLLAVLLVIFLLCNSILVFINRAFINTLVKTIKQ